ncbi:hypothetical protein Forpe1208_v015809 [Fusarium oxysporum f. sp. rapae]|uniref:Uncharacterized protein n=1 Tax=Fusarium oxysporum f. sp. rapae TaxID=485398 RepID=A0A8J5NEI8_FUSOX|nr:hypothetical protein Forpe1208_v015809 [Fusarium oxysporum f. sp. rapae]
MNTVSLSMGLATPLDVLIIELKARLGFPLFLTAGDAAYVLGKKSFDANKTARPEDQRKTKSMIETLEYSPDPQHHTTNTHGTKITTMDNERPVRMDVTSTQLQSCRNAPSPNHGPAT